MGRPRTPPKILKENGAFKKNPKRAREREDEPETDGKLGKPPADFLIVYPQQGYVKAEKLRKIWRQVQRDCDWLDRADRMPVRSYCLATYAVEEAARLNSKQLPSLMAVQRGYMSDLGIPQAHRSKAKSGAGGAMKGTFTLEALVTGE